jgi:molybdate transport system ATP-binding protein
MVKEPRLLVLDEPCQGLDAENRRRVVEAVEAVGRRTGTSVIYVTHEQGALPEIIDHVIKLDGGKVVATEMRREKR